MSKVNEDIWNKWRIREYGQPMSLEDARALRRRVIKYYKHGDLKIMGPYVVKIFSAVLGIIKDYVKKYSPGCIIFTAQSEDRLRL